MHHLGLDIGTKTIVMAYEDGQGQTAYLSEINGYYIFERATPFIEAMLNDPNKKRSDGTERPARWIKLPDDQRIIVLGKDAEELAYSKNDTLLRPMAEGGITADEDSMTVLGSIVHGLLEMAENEVGKFSDEVKLTYCTTARALNGDNNMAYHERVVDLILSGYPAKARLSTSRLRESHAIVLNCSPDGTGIGISWGAGTVTVTYAKYGMEIYSFCLIGAGDWIDEQVAMRHGYQPHGSKLKQRTARETPTTVAKRKHQLDLTPGSEPKDRVGLDLVLHYDVLINQVLDAVVQGFVEHEAEARIDAGVSIYMAGGTASPPGFKQRVLQVLMSRAMPFEVADVVCAERPLLCVAEGLLKAARLF